MSAPVQSLQPMTESVRRIHIVWHEGHYYVSAPNWSGGTVVAASDYDTLKARAEQAERAVDVLKAALKSLTEDPPATLDEPDEDWEVIVKMRAIARAALESKP